MTFFELIRSSLLLDSRKIRPPGTLVQTVLGAWAARMAQIAAGQSDLPDREKDMDERGENG